MSLQIEKLAEQVGQLLKSQQLKLVTVESCTGGGLSYWITSIAGSSAWFDRGYVTYSDQAKIELVGVAKNIIAHYGAVSKETACSMAEGGLHQSQADMCIAITGIAGPTGGSAEKPVGLVWFACAMKELPTIAFVEQFSGTRQTVRDAAIVYALEKLADILLKKR